MESLKVDIEYKADLAIESEKIDIRYESQLDLMMLTRNITYIARNAKSVFKRNLKFNALPWTCVKSFRYFNEGFYITESGTLVIATPKEPPYNIRFDGRRFVRAYRMHSVNLDTTEIEYLLMKMPKKTIRIPYFNETYKRKVTVVEVDVCK